MPDIKAGKPVTIYLITPKPHTLLPGSYGSQEYGFSLSSLGPGWLMCAVVHTLRMYGVESIDIDDRIDNPNFKIVTWDKDKIIVHTQWGYIYGVRREVPHMKIPDGTREVFIDLENVGTYW